MCACSGVSVRACPCVSVRVRARVCVCVCARHLVDVRVPVLVVLRLGDRAVDPGEEGGLGEEHERRVQTERLRHHCLDAGAHVAAQNTRQTQTLSFTLRPSTASRRLIQSDLQ